MEAWMAFVSIMAIVAIVLVAGGLIAFIGHMIIGALDKDNKRVSVEPQKRELIDYSTYKQSEEAPKTKTLEEYDFDAINEAKAESEKKEVEALEEVDFEEDETLEEIENRLKEVKEEQPQVKVAVEETEEPVEEDDDLDFDSMLEEISNDIIEEEKEKASEENAPKMSDELGSYSIEEYMNSIAEEAEVENETEEVVEAEEAETVEEIINQEKVEEVVAPAIEEDEEPEDEALEVELEAVEESDETEEVAEEIVETEKVEEKENYSNKVIEELKAQLADLNRQLEAARSSKVEVVTINMTEEECLARLETLEERLKNVKKDYKENMKDYRPLKKVMNDLERYQTKLRRKETVVAKKKVALYGVNNYVDIDKEKAEKLANELELLDGLSLSVSHCEEVINANKDRFPILEHTNQILEDQIAHIEADIESTQLTLQAIRDQKGENEE